MKSDNQIFRSISVMVMAILLLHVVACGTLLYPERHGQPRGRIDVGVAVLDGIGLVLFLVPGIVAFAVDFATGAIYLPRGKRASISPEADDMVVLRVNPKELSKQKIEEIVYQHTGCPIMLDSDEVQAVLVEGIEDIKGELSNLAEGNGVPSTPHRG